MVRFWMNNDDLEITDNRMNAMTRTEMHVIERDKNAIGIILSI